MFLPLRQFVCLFVFLTLSSSELFVLLFCALTNRCVASFLTLQLSIKKFSKGLTSFVFLSVSGLALCQVIFVYSLSNNSDGDVVFLENYYKLAQPLQSLYYMLFAICTVSVFDRFALFLILTSTCAMINKYTPCCHVVFWDLLLNRCMTTWNLCIIW